MDGSLFVNGTSLNETNDSKDNTKQENTNSKVEEEQNNFNKKKDCSGKQEKAQSGKQHFNNKSKPVERVSKNNRKPRRPKSNNKSGGRSNSHKSLVKEMIHEHETEKDDTQEVEFPFFHRMNRFEGFNGDISNDNHISPLNALIQPTPGWLQPSIATHHNNTNNSSDLWGEGDESEETMQRILQESYLEHHRHAQGAENDEQAMIEKAIMQSLQSERENSQIEHVTEASRGYNDDIIKNEDEEALYDETILQIKIDSLFETYSDDVVAETLSLFEDRKEEYMNQKNKKTRPIPTVEKCLEEALRREKERKIIKDQDELIKLQFSTLAETEPIEIVEQAEKIFRKMASEHRSGSGPPPNVDYCVSLVLDRKKENERKEKEKQLELEKKEKEKQLQKEQQEIDSRKNETREQRAARFAKAFEKRNASTM